MVVLLLLPDGADEFTAKLLATGVLVFHQTFGSGNDGDAEAVEDAGQLGVAGIDAATGRGRALDAGENRGAVDILHGDDDGLVAALVAAGRDFAHEAFVLQDAGEALFELGVRGNALGETGLRRIAEVGQEITDRVCHGWMCWMLARRIISDFRRESGLPGGLGHARDLAGERELAERETGHAETAVEAARAAAERAAVADADLGGIARELRQLLLGGEELVVGRRRVGEDGLQLGALGGVLLDEADALLVTFDGGSFRHGRKWFRRRKTWQREPGRSRRGGTACRGA